MPRGRWGRALAEHPGLRADDTGRELVSRVIVVRLTGEPETTVRRHLEVVACDIATRSALYDYKAASAWAADRKAAAERRPSIPGPRPPCD